MTWFNLSFPACMLLIPLTLVLLWRREVNAPPATPREVALLTTLVIATVVALALHVLLWFFIEPLAWLISFGFFPLFFALAMPILALRHPSWNQAHPQGQSTRRATLIPRHRGALVPRWLWALTIAVGGIALLGVLARGFTGSLSGASLQAWWIALSIELGVLVLTGLLLPLCLTLLRREPEPIDARASPELLHAYDSLRRMKACAFLWLFGVGMNALFGATANAWAWLPVGGNTRIMVLAIGGAAAGSALGIAGAVVGTMAGMRRARIHRLLQELDATASHGV